MSVASPLSKLGHHLHQPGRARSHHAREGSTRQAEDVVPVVVRIVFVDVWLQTYVRRSWTVAKAKHHILTSSNVLPLSPPSSDAIADFACRPKVGVDSKDVFAQLSHGRRTPHSSTHRPDDDDDGPSVNAPTERSSSAALQRVPLDGSPLAVRRAQVVPPLPIAVNSSPSLPHRTASLTVESMGADRPFSTVTMSSSVDSAPSSSTSERADELRPLPQANQPARPPTRLSRTKSLDFEDDAVSLHERDALGRSWEASVNSEEGKVDVDGFDLVDGSTGAIPCSLADVLPGQLLEVQQSSSHLLLPRLTLTAYAAPCFESLVWVSHVHSQSVKHSNDGGLDRLGWSREWLRLQGGEFATWRSSQASWVGSPRCRFSMANLTSVREFDAPLVRTARSFPSKSICLSFVARSFDPSKSKISWLWLRAPTESLHRSLLRVLSTAAPASLARSTVYDPPSFDRLDACYLTRIAAAFPAHLLQRDGRFQAVLQTWLYGLSTSAILEHPDWRFAPLTSELGWDDVREEASFRGVEPTVELGKVLTDGSKNRSTHSLLPSFGHHGRHSRKDGHRDDDTQSLYAPFSPGRETRPLTPAATLPPLPGDPWSPFGSLSSSNRGHVRRPTRSLTKSDVPLGQIALPPTPPPLPIEKDRSPARSDPPLSPCSPRPGMSVRHSLPLSPRIADDPASPTSTSSLSPSSLGVDYIEADGGHEWRNPFVPTPSASTSSHGTHADIRPSPASSIHRRMTDASTGSTSYDYPPSPSSRGFRSRRSTLTSDSSHPTRLFGHHGQGRPSQPSSSDHSTWSALPSAIDEASIDRPATKVSVSATSMSGTDESSWVAVDVLDVAKNND